MLVKLDHFPRDREKTQKNMLFQPSHHLHHVYIIMLIIPRVQNHGVLGVPSPHRVFREKTIFDMSLATLKENPGLKVKLLVEVTGKIPR